MAADTQSLFARARRLTEDGRADEAKHIYREILKREPAHFGALNNLGALLHDTGYRTAARTAYAQAVACHPQNPVGHVNLANALRDAGELAQARVHGETALTLAPDLAGAHQAMAGILAELGEEEEAARHRDVGYANHAAITLGFHGKGKPIRMLLLVSAVGGNVPIRHLIDNMIFQTTVIYADHWTAPLPQHDIVFNAIGDADLCRPAIEAAMRLLQSTHAPILNPPAAALRTGRAQNAARLAALPNVKAAKTINLPREKLSGPCASALLAAHGFEYPLLLRTPGFHTGQHFERIETASQLSATATALPGKELTAIEFLDARGRDGKARKYRVMFVNGEILPLHLCISPDWKVHYFTSAMADCADYRAEEERFLRDMPAVIGSRGMAALTAIRDALGLDYAGIDFATREDGTLLLFEANATMVILAPAADPRWDYRRTAIARVEKAVRTMLATRAAAKPARAA